MTNNTEIKTDHQLQTSVSDELEWTPEVNSAHIGVSADGGVITLTGDVASYSDRIAAKDAVLRVKGVSAVADELIIKSSYQFTGTDSDLAETVAKVLSWTTVIPENSIKAEVRDHIVTSPAPWTGTIQRDAATRAPSSGSLACCGSTTACISSPAPPRLEPKASSRRRSSATRLSTLTPYPSQFTAMKQP
jgi:hypothetical protein